MCIIEPKCLNHAAKITHFALSPSTDTIVLRPLHRHDDLCPPPPPTDHYIMQYCMHIPSHPRPCSSTVWRVSRWPPLLSSLGASCALSLSWPCRRACRQRGEAWGTPTWAVWLCASVYVSVSVSVCVYECVWSVCVCEWVWVWVCVWCVCVLSWNQNSKTNFIFANKNIVQFMLNNWHTPIKNYKQA